MINKVEVIGIDPSINNMGYCTMTFHRDGKNKSILAPYAIEKIGTLKPKLNERMYRELVLFNQLDKFFSHTLNGVCIIEKSFTNKLNLKTSLILAQSRTIPILLAQKYNYSIYEYQNKAAKRLITGFGNASKEDIKKYCNLRIDREKLNKNNLKLDKLDEHAYDAFMMSYCFMGINALNILNYHYD